MKTMNVGLGVAIALIAMLTSCTKDNNANIQVTPATVNNTVSSGSWKITYYWNTDHEETSNYNGYAFSFSANGMLTAVKSSTSITGNWSTGMDDSKVKLALSFITPSEFEKLSEDWHVIEQTASHITLQHISGGNGVTDNLTFDKN
jgi:hypothetical protein